jgi:hypothetical protein
METNTTTNKVTKLAAGRYSAHGLIIENWGNRDGQWWVVLAPNNDKPVAVTYTKRDAVLKAARLAA